MKLLLLAGAGGFLGSAARYAAGLLVLRLTGGPSFPWATLLVNVSGSFLIGMAAGGSLYRWIQATDTRTFLVVGVLGGFTTFSSFAYETVELLRNDQPLLAAANVSLQIVLGLAAVFLGFAAVRSL